MKQNKKERDQIRLITVTFIILASIYVVYGYINKRDYNDPKELVKAVSMLMVLPEEEPTVATVSDLEKLKGQEFFVNANVGDKVLVYLNAGKAILYSPKQNIIINVAPLSATSSKNSVPSL